MKKSLIFIALAPAALFAQTDWRLAQGLNSTAFQQQGWLRLPVSTDTWQHIDGQSGLVAGRPLSADEVRTTVQTLSDGSHINHTETVKFYRDAMGRMLTRTETGAILYDPVAGFTYDITDYRKSYVKSPITPGATVTIAAAAHRSSISSTSGSGDPKWHSTTGNAANAPVTEDLTPQMVNGVLAKGLRLTLTIPAGTFGNDAPLKVVNERWVSDDLKLLVKSSNSDPRFGVTTYELKNIVQADPSPSLFQLPAGYTEAQGH
jgi:hypothetical protein